MENVKADYAQLLESSIHKTNELREVRSQLATARGDREEEIEAELAELAQLRKEAREAAAEIQREGRSIEIEKVRWQQELSDARGEIAEAKATILKQSDKIRELERGYSLKPNPAESRLRLEIGELQEQLADLKQKSATAGKDLPDAATILSQLRGKRKKTPVTLADMVAIWDALEKFWNS